MNYTYPYIQIKQNDEIFFSTKMNISFLKNSVDFHFRNPYDDSSPDSLLAEKYITQLEKNMGIEYESSEKGIQRRTDVRRIKEISEYVQNAQGIIFPTPIVLSFNLFEGSGFIGNTDYTIDEDAHLITFTHNARFSIIDGQHRLAGAVSAYNQIINNNTRKDFELAVTLIPNVGLSKAAQLFIDINGNQRKVNKSMIYDLYSNIDNSQIDNINKYITVTQTLNDREKSPLHQKIKRLGVGTGNISQAFFVDYLMSAYESFDSSREMQKIYSEVFTYFKVVSEIFPRHWRDKTSNLLKTNGFGALLILLPKILVSHKENYSTQEISEHFRAYFAKRADFNWDKEDFSSGTGKKMQKIISEQLHYFKAAE